MVYWFTGIVFLAILMRVRIRIKHRIRSEKMIDEKLVLSIGGIKQYFSIRGKDIDNPVILFLHGGPGGPVTSVAYKYQYLWEQKYTVVNWEQRNAGKTYFLNKGKEQVIADNLSIGVFIDDIYEIATYLTERFHTGKIIIMGHSWGTVIGSLFTIKYPSLVKAYIGIGQVVNLNAGIIKMAKHTLSYAVEHHQQKHITALSQCIEELNVRKDIGFKQVNRITKIARNYIPVETDKTKLLRTLLLSPYFSFKELPYYLKTDKLQEKLIRELSCFDLRTFGNKYNVPIIYILGELDWCSNIISKEYFENIESPLKQYIEIKKSGHMPMLDNPEEFYRNFDMVISELIK